MRYHIYWKELENTILFVTVQDTNRMPKNSERSFITETRVHSEKSSIKVTEYPKPKVELTQLGLHTSVN